MRSAAARCSNVCAPWPGRPPARRRARLDRRRLAFGLQQARLQPLQLGLPVALAALARQLRAPRRAARRARSRARARGTRRRSSRVTRCTAGCCRRQCASVRSGVPPPAAPCSISARTDAADMPVSASEMRQYTTQYWYECSELSAISSWARCRPMTSSPIDVARIIR